MKNKFIFLLITHCFVGVFGSCSSHKITMENSTWENPIRNGISSYGMKDCFMYYENTVKFIRYVRCKNENAHAG